MARRFSVSDEVVTFALNLDGWLSCLGANRCFVEEAYAAFVELLVRIEKAQLLGGAKYFGLDLLRPGYSIYTFDEDPYEGWYTSSGLDVVLISVRLNEKIFELNFAVARVSVA